MIKITMIQTHSGGLKALHTKEDDFFSTFEETINDYITIVKNDQDLASLTYLIQELVDDVLLRQTIIIDSIAIPLGGYNAKE